MRYSSPTYEPPVSCAIDCVVIVDENNTVLSGDDIAAFGKPTKTSDYRANTVTPTASLVFKPVPSVTTYVTYSQGLETGGTDCCGFPHRAAPSFIKA